MTDLVDEVMEFTLQNYKEWSVVVECFNRDDIVRVIGGASTLEEALSALDDVLEAWGERRAASALSG